MLVKYIIMFQCKLCNYSTNDRRDYKRHAASLKHINNGLHSDSSVSKHTCHECGKMFKTQSGLWKHTTKNQCKIGNTGIGNLQELDIIGILQRQIETQQVQLKEQSSQIKEQVVQMNELMNVIKKSLDNRSIITTTTNNTNITNHISAHTFLEQRKETAIDINDFVDSIDVPMEITIDKERNKFETVFVEHLKKLNPEEMPIYCRDKKRNNYSVMINKKWVEKDEAIILVSKNKIHLKHLKNLDGWKETHPGWNAGGECGDKYMKMLNSLMDGASDKEQTKSKHNMLNIINEAIYIKQAMMDSV